MNTLTLVVLKANGEMTEEQQIPPYGPGSLDALQRAVGGYIETVPWLELFDYQGEIHPCVAFCNEYGKLNGLPVNVEATDRWDRHLETLGVKGNTDYLVGDIAFVFGDPEAMRLFRDGPDEEEL